MEGRTFVAASGNWFVKEKIPESIIYLMFQQKEVGQALLKL